ncbi:hypothetical protein BGZ51_006679 [Haplosporangium sp. Z 767]|nr:hypothetical protein BGZ51_006679 [Haplosporangium sp. Z 767]KAF9194477.1 hypothetical protein BGZ50_006202 [Haplosporangium sp. Z 11]
MPPKRPATDTPARTGGSKAKVAKTTSTRGKKNQTKTDTSRAAEADQKTSQKFNQDQCYTWFKSYTGLEEDEDSDADQIGPGGITKLCEDLGVSLEAVDMLVLAYHLQADTMPVFTKDEWIKGMSKLEIDSITKLKAAMPGLVARLKEPQHFKEFYRYIFMFAKDSEQKCMPLETKKPVKVINKDQWYNFLDFSESVPEDVSNYDGASSAWPVLMDEYVEWRNEGSS